MHDQARRVARHCKERVGDSLRAVHAFGPDQTITVYQREDVGDQMSARAFRDAIRHARTAHGAFCGAARTDIPLGNPIGGLFVFDGALVAILPIDDEQGVIVSLEPDVGRNLMGFMQECLAASHEQLEDEYSPARTP